MSNDPLAVLRMKLNGRDWFDEPVTDLTVLRMKLNGDWFDEPVTDELSYLDLIDTPLPEQYMPV